MEENTADFIETPSAHEVNHAITSKMGNLIVLVRPMALFDCHETKGMQMKSVTKFKNLLDKKKDVESDHSPVNDGSNPDSIDQLSPQPTLQQLGNSGSHDEFSTEGSSVVDGGLRGTTASSSGSVGSYSTSRPGTVTPRSVAASSRNNSERSNSGDMKPKHLQRILTASSDKSHAHDPSLDEPLYLGIGAGKNDLMEKPDLLEVPDDDAIAESPQAAEFSIYDLAYEKEVERIRKAQGHEAKVYSNRRVEVNQELETDVAPSKSKGGWGQLLNRVLEKNDEKTNEEAPSGT